MDSSLLDDLAHLPPEEQRRAIELLRELERRENRQKFHNWFPDHDVVEPDGSVIYHARAGYTKHLEHFEAGATYQQRLFMAANRVGKTIAGSYEVAAHLTGLYKPWWPGRRWDRPVMAWVAGKSFETTRDIVQKELLGPVFGKGAGKAISGEGMIPGDLLGAETWRQGIANLVDTIPVRHVSGGWSLLGFKSYDQGIRAFEGTAQDVIWLDEEAPMDVYGEAMIRLMTTRGSMISTFTPLQGITDLVKQFYLPDSVPDEL